MSSKEIWNSNQDYKFIDLNKIFNEKKELKSLPRTMRILFENCLRNGSEFNSLVSLFQDWLQDKEEVFKAEIPFFPATVLMQDFTGVPAVVDLAAMRDAAFNAKKDPSKINPLIPVNLVIDHSVQVNNYGSKDSLIQNNKKEFVDNQDRYEFLKWGQKSFKNFRLVPPGAGICHQVNLEYLSSVIFKNDESKMIYPETVVGTDSHTTMINGLGVLGWGVGGIEAESAMLGESIPMNIPKVVGFKLFGSLKEGVTATDLVLTITHLLRKKGVVGKFVEFYGDGLNLLSLPDRATIANMAPEYGATCGFFPVDEKTIEYLEITGRSKEKIELVEEYCKSQMLFRNSEEDSNIHFSDYIELDLSVIRPCVAGPSRPQDLRLFSEIFDSLKEKFPSEFSEENMKKIFDVGSGYCVSEENDFAKDVWASMPDNIFENKSRHYSGDNLHDISNIENGGLGDPAAYELKKQSNIFQKKNYLKNGDIVLAAITSCTNTSNPSVLIAAGLLAKAAYENGLRVNPLIKTSLAPGSKVVTEYLEESGLQEYLDKLGFNVVGYGCTTCIGNSGSLKPEIEKTISENDLCVGAVLSGNRNFEGRIQPFIKANYLASPPLVIAFALAGSLLVNFDSDPIGFKSNGDKLMLKDLWPSDELIQEHVKKFVKKEMFLKEYARIFEGDDEWKKINAKDSEKYNWDEKNTYIKNPPYFENFSWERKNVFSDLKHARILAVLGDSITTDHISPAGSIKKDSEAGMYLIKNGIDPKDFNSYGSRRGNHEVMIRGTFANIRLQNFMTKDSNGLVKQGGFTRYFSEEENWDDISHITKSEEEMINSELSIEKNDNACNNSLSEKNIVSIFEASLRHKARKVPLVIFAGKDYGSGSSRDWAAKGTMLLGVRAVIARSFERIHRSNLVGMGVFPFIFEDNEMSFEKLNIKGDEKISINFSEIKQPLQKIICKIEYSDGRTEDVNLIANILNDSEIETLQYGGIMQKVLVKIYS